MHDIVDQLVAYVLALEDLASEGLCLSELLHEAMQKRGGALEVGGYLGEGLEVVVPLGDKAELHVVVPVCEKGREC